MNFLVSENGNQYIILSVKEAVEKYGIPSDDLITALNDGSEIYSPLAGCSITIDEPFDNNDN